MFEPRQYQQEAISSAIAFFKSNEKGNALQILPTGSGKSVIIANIIKELKGKYLVLQPSKEILEQNVAKYMSYGFRCGIYSASAGSKFISDTTFATIGSIIKKKHLFMDIDGIIIDECHLVNAEAGMYSEFINSFENMKVLGLTATPYRLSSSMEGSMLKFITRTNPRIFNKVIYYIQNSTLFDAGHLSKLEYFAIDVVDRSKLQVNSTGSDFTEASLRAYYRRINMEAVTAKYANRLLAKRKNLLVFCSMIAEAEQVKAMVPGSEIVTGETKKDLRAKILSDFKAGRLRCIINVGVLTTGFDYPALETVLLARSTMSMGLYYQMIGRGMRPSQDKESCYIVDLGGNVKFFGQIESMKIYVNDRGLFSIWNNGKQLTNVIFTKN